MGFFGWVFYCQPFLQAVNREVAKEIREEYTETMSRILFSYFKSYTGRLGRLQYEESATREAVLWNRNRNFLKSRNRTISYGSGTGTRYKIMYLISFIFSLYKSFLCIKARFLQKFLLKKFAFYGLDIGAGTGTINFLKSEPEP